MGRGKDLCQCGVVSTQTLNGSVRTTGRPQDSDLRPPESTIMSISTTNRGSSISQHLHATIKTLRETSLYTE